MEHYAPRLIEVAPKFSSKGGLFYVDFGVADLPVIALNPNVMLKAIAKAKAEYDQWTLNQRRRGPG